MRLKETGKQFGVYVFVLSFFETLDKEGQAVDTKFLSIFNIFLNFFYLINYLFSYILMCIFLIFVDLFLEKKKKQQNKREKSRNQKSFHHFPYQNNY